MSKYHYRLFSKEIKHLYLRNEKFHYRRSIPQDLRHLYDGQHWVRALKTDDAETALCRRVEVHKECEGEFAFARQGTPPKLQKAVNDSFIDENGLGTLTTDDLAKPENSEEFDRRVQLALNSDNPRQELGPIFGTSAKPLMLSDVVERWYKILEYDLLTYSPRQQKKKRSEKDNAITRLIGAIGDMAVKDLKKSDANDFVACLKNEVIAGDIKADTANKLLAHIKAALNQIIQADQILPYNPFDKLSLKAEKGQRPPFSTKWITDKIFAQQIVDQLTSENFCLLILIVELGAGFRELCFLEPGKDIDLNASIPHVHIRPNNFRPKLKTGSRARSLPLSKVASNQLRALPNLFESYRLIDTGHEKASAQIGSFLKSNGLLETPAHKSGSFRHSFMDRVRSANVSFDIQSYLMGHTHKANMSMQYGQLTLDQLKPHIEKTYIWADVKAKFPE